jgi:hypothetical protein
MLYRPSWRELRAGAWVWRELAEGDVNVVEVQQDPNQSSEDLASDLASEGKPRSITYFC